MSASNMNFYGRDLVIRNNPNIATGKVLRTDESLNSDDDEEDGVEVGGQQVMRKGDILVEWQDRTGSLERTFLFALDLNPNLEVLPERKVKLYDRPLGTVVRKVGSKEDQLGYCRSTSITADVQVVGTQRVLTNIEPTDLELREDSIWVLLRGFCAYMYYEGWSASFIFFMQRTIGRRQFQRGQPRIGTHRLLTMKDSYNVVTLQEWKTLMAAKLNILSHRVEIPWKMSRTLKKLYTYGLGYVWIIICFLGFFTHFFLWSFVSSVWSKGLKGISFEFIGQFFEFYCFLKIYTAILRAKTFKEMYFETALFLSSFCGLIGLLLPNFHNKLDDYFGENVKYLAVSRGEKYFNFLGHVFVDDCLIESIRLLVWIARRGLRRSLKDFAVFVFRREKALVPEEELTVEILVTQTRADVVWQDGTVERNIPSTKLSTYWYDFDDEYLFFPGNRVLRSEGSFAYFPSNVFGIVKKVNHTRRTAIIKWMKIIDTDGFPYAEFVTDQEVSVYDIIHDPESERDVIGGNSLQPSPEVGANSELSSRVNEDQPIDAEELPKDVTEGNASANENILKDMREHDNMPKTNIPRQGALSTFESVPDSHKYKQSILQPNKLGVFASSVRKEMDILKSYLPDGIVVKSFEDRIDLISVLIKGPKMTPYEDGLFFFDLQLPDDYPNSPPLCHYVSYCKGDLNPNLYEGGRVRNSLLGTFEGQDSQMWNKGTSSLLQVIVSIQSLILVSEPYYNEPGCEREKSTHIGNEKSRLYNEKVLLKLVEAMIKLAMNPPELFRKEISDHFQFSKMVERLERWVEMPDTWNSTPPASSSTSGKLHEHVIGSQDEASVPDFPLIPASKGFCLTLKKSLEKFKSIVAN